VARALLPAAPGLIPALVWLVKSLSSGHFTELFRTSPSLDFSDCLMLHLARKAEHLPPGTFDRKLSKV
jgi:hypothetical protein